jgi:signal transduction histidine kinase
MRSRHLLLDTGRRLLAMFLAIAALLAGTLLWLGWQLASQDREVAVQRLQERRENTADLAAAALQKSLSQAEEQLTHLATLRLPELREQAARAAASFAGDSVIVLTHGAGLEAYPEKRLPFYPDVQAAPGPPASLFAEAEALEFRKSDYPRAMAALQAPARSNDPTIQASALLRMARIHRKQGHWNDALASYQAMLGLDGATVEALPAALVARQARMRICEEQNRDGAARQEAAALAGLIDARPGRLSRGAYEFFSSEARRVLGPAAGPVDSDPAFALAAAVEGVHDAWQVEKERSGRRLFREAGQGMLALWRSSGETMVAMVVGPKWLEAQWSGGLRSALANREMSLILTDAEGHALLGGLPPAGPARQSVRLASTTQLPWNLHVVTTNPAAGERSFDVRRRLLATALGIITLLILAGSYLIARAVTRELAVSRLQSDFVSAVSHEFRTPLTTLCLLTEQLADGRIASPGDRTEYYGVLARESQRLRRLVEGLLNFGRMEAGAAQYRFETIDPAELVRQVTAEFGRDGEGRPIEVHAKADAPLVRADRAALACAVWNLLDNAVKYSPECSAIQVDVEGEAGRAAIRVRDHGQGIPPGERQRIFDKFVRGAAAAQAGARGVGVGLAMVSHIVSAHKGEIRLESNPGEGSSFTLLLPAVS